MANAAYFFVWSSFKIKIDEMATKLSNDQMVIKKNYEWREVIQCFLPF